MPLTDEQQRVADHNPDRNARILAGPGTGKSTASVALLQSVDDLDPPVRVKMVTFTRAATAELARKLDGDFDFLPSTIHSLALSILARNPEACDLPTPLRIADKWEAGELVRKDLARRLRAAGHEVDARKVKKLEREMSGRWEAMDERPGRLAAEEPELCAAYVGHWNAHRDLFGYSLLAELTFKAQQALEDFDPELDPVDLLVVDEYQDLNRADIRFIEELHNRGAAVVAIGDPDQSIYGWRMAAPEGINNFPEAFVECDDYPLTLCWRCGTDILRAANTLIQTAPDRVAVPELRPGDPAKAGVFAYLRFADDASELRGVVDMVRARCEAGVEPGEIAILVRSETSRWANPIREALKPHGIPVLDTGWVDEALKEPGMREGFARARLLGTEHDSLAWWTLLRVTNGISRRFEDYVARAATAGETFGQALLRLHPAFPEAPTAASATRTRALVDSVSEQRRLHQAGGPPDLPADGWGGWLVHWIGEDRLSENAIRLLRDVGSAVDPDVGLLRFLNYLGPLGEDLAAQADAVRILSMSASKGLTVNTCIVMGVEAPLIPHPRADLNEERRLLYVAMTRATDFCALTWAQRRTGATARLGGGQVGRPRGRSRLFHGLNVDVLDGPAYVADLLGA